MSEQKIPIPAMLYNAAVGGHVTNSQQIIDEDYNIEQKDVNKEVLGVPYNATTPNGMGRIVLKKNDNFKQVVEAQTNGNTIFVIKYDFALTDNVTVPANCMLEFDGGSISGQHILTGNNTGIRAGLVNIFNTDITLAGSWNVNELNVKWFGAKGDGITNDTLAFKNCIESPAVSNGGYCIKIPKGHYVISDTIYMPHRQTEIAGEIREQWYYDETTPTCLHFTAQNKELFRVDANTSGISFRNLGFKCYNTESNSWYNNTTAIKFKPIAYSEDGEQLIGASRVSIEKCSFMGFTHVLYFEKASIDASNLSSFDWRCDGVVISNCNFYYFTDDAIYVNSRNCLDYSTIKDCEFIGMPYDPSKETSCIRIERIGVPTIISCSFVVLIPSNFDSNSEAAKKSNGIGFYGICDLINIYSSLEEQTPYFIYAKNNYTNQHINVTGCNFDYIYIDSPISRTQVIECNNGQIVVESNDSIVYTDNLNRVQIPSKQVINSFAFNVNNKESLYIDDLRNAETMQINRALVYNPFTVKNSIDVTGNSRTDSIKLQNRYNLAINRNHVIYLSGYVIPGSSFKITVKGVSNVAAGEIVLGTIDSNDLNDNRFSKTFSYYSRILDNSAIILVIEDCYIEYTAKIETVSD